MKILNLILISILSIGFVSCSSLQSKTNEEIKVLSSAAQTSIKAGRFDLADKYNQDLIKLVGPPKKPIKINQFQTHFSAAKTIDKEKDKTFVVLPPGVNDSNVVVKDSIKFNEIIAADKQLQKSEKENESNIVINDQKTDKLVEEIHKAAEKPPKSLFGSIFSFFKWSFGFGLIGTILILVILFLFAPQLLPVFFDFVSWIIKWIFNLIVSIGTGFSGLIYGLFKKK